MGMKNMPIFSFSDIGEVDSKDGVIRNVSVMTKGQARGHDLMIDDTTLEQVLKASEEFQNGVKVKVDHGGGVFSIVGSVKNLRIDGDRLKGDLHLLKTAEKADHIMELARELPDTFGMSVSINGQHETIAGVTYARCSRIRSCDIVTDPAANPDGLLEEPKVDTVSNHSMGDTQPIEKQEQASELGDCNKWQEGAEKRFASLEAMLGEIKKALTPEEEKEEKEEGEDMDAGLSKSEFESKMDQLEAKLEAVSETLKNIALSSTPAAGSESEFKAPQDFNEAVEMTRLQNNNLKPSELIRLAEKQYPELRKTDLKAKGLQII